MKSIFQETFRILPELSIGNDSRPSTAVQMAEQIKAITQLAEDALSAMLQLGLIRLPELEMVQERPGGPLPPGWNNMSRPPETGR
jgi:hypothetical protein